MQGSFGIVWVHGLIFDMVADLTLVLSLCTVVVLTRSSFILPSGSVSSLVVGGDRVFASTGSTVYQLSSDLQHQQRVECNQLVLKLAATQDNQWLVICYYYGICSALNGSDLSATDDRTVFDIMSPGELINQKHCFVYCSC